LKIFAVRLKGRIGVRKEINATLDALGLKRRFNAIVVDPTPNIFGMLKKAQNYIAYGEISEENYSKILLLPSSLKKEKNNKIFLRLPPPKFGLKRKIKHLFPKGEAGYHGKEINYLIERFLLNVKA
jgi:ribosomal protein L30/L7E